MNGKITINYTLYYYVMDKILKKWQLYDFNI